MPFSALTTVKVRGGRGLSPDSCANAFLLTGELSTRKPRRRKMTGVFIGGGVSM
jgi:hypothetical protein